MPKADAPSKEEQDAIMSAAHTLRDEMLACIERARNANPNKNWERVLVGHAIVCMAAKLEVMPGMEMMGSLILGDLLTQGGAKVVGVGVEIIDGKEPTKH